MGRVMGGKDRAERGVRQAAGIRAFVAEAYSDIPPSSQPCQSVGRPYGWAEEATKMASGLAPGFFGGNFAGGYLKDRADGAVEVHIHLGDPEPPRRQRARVHD